MKSAAINWHEIPTGTYPSVRVAHVLPDSEALNSTLLVRHGREEYFQIYLGGRIGQLLEQARHARDPGGYLREELTQSHGAVYILQMPYKRAPRTISGLRALLKREPTFNYPLSALYEPLFTANTWSF